MKNPEIRPSLQERAPNSTFNGYPCLAQILYEAIGQQTSRIGEDLVNQIEMSLEDSFPGEGHVLMCRASECKTAALVVVEAGTFELRGLQADKECESALKQ